MNAAASELFRPCLEVRSGSPTRILLLIDTPVLAPGGTERFVCNLIERLDPAQFEIDVVQLSGAPPTRWRELPGGHHVRFEHRPVDAVYGPAGIALYRELRQRVLDGRYRIVQSQLEKSDILCALLPDVPGCIRISNRRDTGFKKGRLLRYAFRVLNRRFDRVVAPSQAILDGLVSHESVRRSRTRCLPNGVDTMQFAPLPLARRAGMRAALGLPPHGFLFGSVSRLVEVKRQRDMIDAFALATGNRPEAHLVLVGEGPLEAALRAQVARHALQQRVLFLGGRSDVHQLLPLLDVFVLSSSTEGMSNAVLEAMACGLPTIATAVGGNPETLDPSTGLLVPPLAPERLAEAMRALLDDPQRACALGRRARQRAVEQFSIDAMVRRFAELYRHEVPA